MPSYMKAYILNGTKVIDEFFPDSQRKQSDYEELIAVVSSFYSLTMNNNATKSPCAMWKTIINRDHFEKYVKPQLSVLKKEQSLNLGRPFKEALLKAFKTGFTRVNSSEVCNAVDLLPNDVHQIKALVMTMFFELNGISHKDIFSVAMENTEQLPESSTFRQKYEIIRELIVSEKFESVDLIQKIKIELNQRIRQALTMPNRLTQRKGTVLKCVTTVTILATTN